MADREENQGVEEMVRGLGEEAVPALKVLALAGELRRNLGGLLGNGGDRLETRKAYRVYVTLPLTDEDVQDADKSFDDRRELEVAVGVPDAFHTRVSYVIDRFTATYTELLGHPPVAEGYRLLLLIGGAVVMPDEIVGHAFDVNARVDAARVAIPGAGHARNRNRRARVAEEEDVYANYLDADSVDSEDSDLDDLFGDANDGGFVAAGKSKVGDEPVISFGKMVTQGVKQYEWVLEFETLDSWKALDEHVTTSAKFPFSWIGFAQPDRKEAPAVGASVAGGRWIWDGWYSLLIPDNTITYGLNAIWSNGGKFEFKVILTKATEENQTVFSMTIPSHQEVCAPDVRWPGILDGMRKKDLEFVIFGLSKHWKVTLKSFTEA